MDGPAEWFTASATALLALSAVVAALFGRRQITETHSIAKIDRTLRFHHDFDAGPVQDAKHRLLDALWFVGAEGTADRVVCYQPRFAEFLPAVPHAVAGGLAEYRAEGIDTERHRPLEDVLLILGSFQRLHGAKCSATLDHPTYRRLFGNDVLWWNELFARFRPVDERGNGDTPLIKALRELADDELNDQRISRGHDAIPVDVGVRVRRAENFVMEPDATFCYPGFGASPADRNRFKEEYAASIERRGAAVRAR